MQNITTDTLYHSTINSEYMPIPDKVIGEIVRLIQINHLANSPVGQTFGAGKLYREIDWKWMGQRGTLTKRISKWYYEEYKKNLLDVTLTAIGNAVRREIVKNQEYHIDFTKKFNWRDGQFADGGSCFWDSRAEARVKMEESGKFLAVRFFRENDQGTFIKNTVKINQKENIFYAKDDRYTYSGIARAWAYTDEIVRKDKSYPVWIIFNGYGIATKQIASIIATFHNQSVKRITVTNNSHTHGGLYINGDGYLIGNESLIKDIASFDFGIQYGCEMEDSEARQFKKKEEPLEKQRKAPRPTPIGRPRGLNPFGNSFNDRMQGLFEDALAERGIWRTTFGRPES